VKSRRGQLKAEIESHRQMIEDQLLREGMSPRDAAAAARRQFGNESSAIEDSSDEWPFAWLSTLLRDIRFAARVLRKRPGLTLTAVLIAGLGVGANTAIVGVLRTAMLKPLGLHDTDGVIVATVRLNKIKLLHAETSAVEFRELGSMTDAFQSIAAMEGRAWTFESAGPTGSEALRLRGRAVTPDFFTVFRERPHLGRFFNPDDNNSLVLSYAFWKSQFGADPNILNRTVILDRVAYRIVGVAGPTFRFPATADAWSSLRIAPSRFHQRGYNMNLTVVARLKDSVTIDRAADRVNRYVAVFKATPDGKEMADYGYFIDLEPFSRYVAGDLRRPLWLLWAAALAVLLTACANIAVLLLSRTAGRRREIAIRLSLGATRLQILRQLAVESTMLGALGGVFGIVLGALALSLIGRLTLPGKPILELASLDLRLVLYGMAISLVCGFAFGVAPAIQLARSSQTSALSRAGRHRFQDLFIAAQIAAALVLLISTGLLLRSLWTLEGIQPGFDPSRLTTAFFLIPPGDPGFADRVEQNLRSTPGVEASATAYPIPFTGGGLTSGFQIVGKSQSPTSGLAWHGEAYFVSPGYLDALRIPILRGRNISPADTATTPHVCLIDAKFARRFFSDEDPIGHEIGMYGQARIVGIVSDIRSSTLEEESRATVYYPVAQQVAGFQSRAAIVRSQGPAAPIVRAAVRAASASSPVYDVQTMDERIGESLGIRRTVATLVCVFAALCILLAAIGLHGVVSQVVGERAGEIAVRMALGARPAQILSQFLSYGLKSGIAGLAVGLGLALYAQRWLGNLLFDVKPFDPATFLEACAAVILVLAAAVFRPARRASKLSPHSILRHE
jgi:predicted permease